MKKLWMSAAVAALIATTSGCVSYNVSQPSAPLEGTVKTDLKADVKVGGTITGESSTNVLFNFLSFGGDNHFADGVTYGGASGGGGLGLALPDPVSTAKAAAAYKAVNSSGADLIVAPRYEVSVQDYFIFKKVNVKVTGSKGSISSIR
ncbi:hypothetical protein ALO95_04236 [Pseudomonas syringae pv. antirrhini]|uniref:Lipoprotein n=1 Tax=Pseudomonas syringae pv. antirrhini TaxID=251702 RepID=A0A0P9LIM7_9PSED|nr:MULTISPECIES: hypothetical protein [Pseudomonas]KPW42531.1 Uncharacterized protein ALO87_03898 [Pseudomonas syringae pv. apii]KPW44100.1 Uncharacterized protein ALO88_03524 [Pseudomonas syringae pv. antirrhini]RMP38314.1 hypothetical protein ALQ24_01970 [Pseudomonas syringae pv. antirrhini]RMP40071.1 hypothetical protein ALQ23_04326 [Pseudomonas syringae pv. antirrhini]RMW30058.1 hypothetical protein ALO95_04236 [Pseudomonas syringae pv. antirrhini]